MPPHVCDTYLGGIFAPDAKKPPPKRGLSVLGRGSGLAGESLAPSAGTTTDWRIASMLKQPIHLGLEPVKRGRISDRVIQIIPQVAHLITQNVIDLAKRRPREEANVSLLHEPSDTEIVDVVADAGELIHCRSVNGVVDHLFDVRESVDDPGAIIIHCLGHFAARGA